MSVMRMLNRWLRQRSLDQARDLAQRVETTQVDLAARRTETNQLVRRSTSLSRRIIRSMDDFNGRADMLRR